MIRAARVMAIAGFCVLATVVCADDKPNTATKPEPRSDVWWQERHKSFNDRAKQGNVDLIFIGDSITQGWEGEGKEIWEKHYVRRNAMNLGINGDRTQQVLWRLDNGNIEGIKPKLAVLMIGTNNSNNNDNTAEEIGAGIQTIVKKLREKLPETKVLVLGVFPRGDKPNPQREKNAKASEIAAKIVDNKMVYYFDFGPKYLEPDGTLSKEVMPDLLHLNRKSYETWATNIEDKVAKLMGEKEDLTEPKARPVNDDAWQKRCRAANDEINERVKKGNVDLIFVGDSITEGWKDPGKEIWDKYYAPRNAVNMGISGDGTREVLWRLDHGNVDGIKPKLAVVMIGTNNSNPHSNSAEDVADGIKAVVQRLREKLPETKVLLLAIFPRTDDYAQQVPVREKSAKASKIASQVADNKMIFYLDIEPKLLEPDGTISREVMPDLIHPGTKGYKIWAESIEDNVAELMGEKK